MKDKDFKRRIAYEVLIILGMLALLLFICRLWPILLLVILGIFAAAIILLVLSQRQAEVVEPMQKPEPQEKPELSEKDVESLVFGMIQQKITQKVAEDYPQARWVWKSPHPKRHVLAGDEVFILLNHAGGYREAKVKIINLHVSGLEYVHLPSESGKEVPEPESNVETPEEKDPPNYEFLAFEWVDAHAVELNERCNEYIAKKCDSLLLTADELPDQGSWPDICRELARNGMEDCECLDKGIQINFTQKNCRKE